MFIGEKRNTQKGKTMFYSIQYKNGWLAASKIFHMFTQSIKFYYTFHFIITMFEKCHSQIDSENEWLLESASFAAKFGLVFSKNLKMENPNFLIY